MRNNPFYDMSAVDFHLYCVNHIPLSIYIENVRDDRVPNLNPRPIQEPRLGKCHFFITDKNNLLTRGLTTNCNQTSLDFLQNRLKNPKEDCFLRKRKVVNNWFESRRLELMGNRKPFYRYVPKVPKVWDNNDYAIFVTCKEEWERYNKRFKLGPDEINPLAKRRHVSFEEYDMSPLLRFRTSNQRQDTWWIVPDSIVVMHDNYFLRSLVRSDSTLHIKIAYELWHDIDRLKHYYKGRQVVNAVLDFTDNEVGHYKYISAQGCVQNEDLIEDNPHCTDSIINCCLQLTTKQYYVVLLTEDDNKKERAKELGIPVFSREEAKALITRNYCGLPCHKLTVTINNPQVFTRQIVLESVLQQNVQKAYVPQQTYVPQRACLPQLGNVPQQTYLSQQGNVPQQTYLSQQGNVPQQTYLSQQGNVPQQTYLSQQGNVPQQTYLSQQGNVPQQTYLSQQGNVPQQAFLSQQGNVPQQAYLSQQVKLPQQAYLSQLGNVPQLNNVPHFTLTQNKLCPGDIARL